MIIWKITFIVGICVFSIPTVADEPLQIAWKDLRPVETVTDPYEKLSPEQLRDLGQWLRLRRLMAEKKIPTQREDATVANEIENRLREANLDIGWLLAQRRSVRRLREIQGNIVQTKYEGKVVQIAGFVIPLKRVDGLVSEFLLVPAFDYCCKTVPPAPNQTVLVRTKDGVKIQGRFAAAQVSGRMSAKKSQWIIQTDNRPAEFHAAYEIEPVLLSVHIVGR